MSDTAESGAREHTMNGSTGIPGGGGTREHPAGRSSHDLRERAAVVSAEILNRLADPAATMAATRSDSLTRSASPPAARIMRATLR
ncbi:hypothetical protein AB0J75_34930, partial [Streptomyces sp. NPDC049744]